jgi:protein farnesyltransferase subunit beta
MYSFFMSLKQPDGSFLVTHHGEVDVRGIYCLLCVAIMLDIVTPELVEGTAGFIASCQTYEGGFSSSSQPYFAPISTPEERLKVLRAPRPPLGEAHGGYTFCALASWVMLQPFIKADPSPDPPSINRRTLLRWLTHMQGSEIELGGFRGRTNKLVDGCYAWWVGGAFGLLGAMEAAGIRPTGSAESVVPEDDGHDDRWADDDGKNVS